MTEDDAIFISLDNLVPIGLLISESLSWLSFGEYDTRMVDLFLILKF